MSHVGTAVGKKGFKEVDPWGGDAKRSINRKEKGATESVEGTFKVGHNDIKGSVGVACRIEAREKESSGGRGGTIWHVGNLRRVDEGGERREEAFHSDVGDDAIRKGGDGDATRVVESVRLADILVEGEHESCVEEGSTRFGELPVGGEKPLYDSQEHGDEKEEQGFNELEGNTIKPRGRVGHGSNRVGDESWGGAQYVLGIYSRRERC